MSLLYDDFVPQFQKFLSDVLFDFSPHELKGLAKLKVVLDINFQTFDKIVTHLKSNASFLTSSMMQVDLESFRLVKFPTFTSSIMFLKILVKNLKAYTLENGLLKVLFRICEKLSDLEDPVLNFETFEFMLHISEQVDVDSPKSALLFGRMLGSQSRLSQILHYSRKWLKKKRFTKQLTDLWREHSDALFSLIRSGRAGTRRLLTPRHSEHRPRRPRGPVRAEATRHGHRVQFVPVEKYRLTRILLRPVPQHFRWE